MSEQEKSSQSRQVAKTHLDRADVVIIGNGIAGLTAAIETRRLAPEKRIVMVTDQIHPTINTPALKQFAVGKLTQEQLLAYPAGTERAERIHVLTAHVERIHAQEKYIEVSGGRGFGYESLLIATGSTPNGLPTNVPGRDFDGVMTLHRLQDYLDLRRRLGEVREAVVIGGGVHANETVMGLLHWGIQVHWLIRSDNFMHRILDEVSSERVLEGVRRAGANVYTQTEVVGVVGRVGSVAGVVTNHQELLPCQLVLSCTGTQAVTTLAEHCDQPLRHKKGILVDDQLRTSVRDIYAAGDVAALKNPYTGSYETRAQWYAAVSQGRTVAAMIAGHEELARKPFGVQWHATHLGEHYMLTIGNPLSQGNNVMTLTDDSQGGYRRLALVDNRLVGYLSLGNKQPDSLAIKRIIDEGHPVQEIARALLKGNFDARAYLSQQRTRSAQGTFNGGQPVLSSGTSRQRPVSTVQLKPLITPQPPRAVPARPAAAETGPLAPVQSRPASVQETDALRRITPAAQQQSPAIYEEEQISPFTGTLPNLPGSQVEEEEVSPFTGTLPDIGGRLALEEEEISPFAGNLPSVRGKIVESTLATAPQEVARSFSKLWSYQTSKPVKPKQSDKKREPEQSRAGSLWSYSNRTKR